MAYTQVNTGPQSSYNQLAANQMPDNDRKTDGDIQFQPHADRAHRHRGLPPEKIHQRPVPAALVDDHADDLVIVKAFDKLPRSDAPGDHDRPSRANRDRRCLSS